MAFSIIDPVLQLLDDNGGALSGGKVYIYEPGTTTPKNSYPTPADADAATNPNTNPVILDAGGRAGIWGVNEESYKVRVETSAGVLVSTVDNIQSPDIDLRADLASTAAGKGASLVKFAGGSTVEALSSTTSGKGASLVAIADAGNYYQGDTTAEAALQRAARRWWNPRPQSLEIVAHRGFATLAPENTLAAFSNAHRLGADSLEFDVQVTSDGEFVIFHDATLDDLTDGTGAVADHTLAEIEALDAGSHFSSVFASCKIPTLSETLDFCYGRFKTIYPEIKSRMTNAEIEAMVTAIEDAGMIGNCVIQSFFIDEIEYVRSLNDEVGVCLAADGSLTGLSALAALGPPCLMFMDYVDVLANPTWPETIRAAGADLMVYTVNDNKAIQQLLAMGVTRIATDRAYFGEASRIA